MAKGFEIPDMPNFTDRFIYVYKIIKNLYSLEYSRKTCYDYLNNSPLKHVWRQSSIDECPFTKNRVVLVIYVYGTILISPSKQNVNNEITSLMKDYDITE